MKTQMRLLCRSIALVLALGTLGTAVETAAGTSVSGTLGCHEVCADLYEVTCTASQVTFILAGPDAASATAIVSVVKTLPAPTLGGERDAITQLVDDGGSEIALERPAKGTIRALVSIAGRTGAIPVDYHLDALCGVLDATNTFVEVAPPVVKIKQDE